MPQLQHHVCQEMYASHATLHQGMGAGDEEPAELSYLKGLLAWKVGDLQEVRDARLQWLPVCQAYQWTASSCCIVPSTMLLTLHLAPVGALKL
jgi:hypothetical protein